MPPSADDDSGLAREDPLIEDFGTHIGRAMGWPPMAGRTAGVLMLSEQPMTLTELQESLDASKGSVSEITRLLMTSGTVARFKPAGSRQFVYQWRDDAWIGCLQHQLLQTTQLFHLAQSAQSRSADLSAAQGRRIQEMNEFYGYMVRRLEELVEDYTARWHGQRSAPPEPPRTESR